MEMYTNLEKSMKQIIKKSEKRVGGRGEACKSSGLTPKSVSDVNSTKAVCMNVKMQRVQRVQQVQRMQKKSTKINGNQ